ncbi:hypothetical protein RGF97_20360 [Streptomyces roseicoloratus]|uniref:AG1 protein n=1 Tax=Streptomyces roseicoloratus TaxID=2508722 RepID=A0ABY9S0U7_9ACTN|nr:hypothetical protein [Streptomyces roseicoloratus]WMX46710.1 hypothetical protein RGF97_20360 [Streptomyces roseicoloratus]
MPWDEWEQLKAETAARQSPSMRLNQVAPAPGGGYSEDLKTDKRAWVKAGEGVTTPLTKLETGQAGLGDGQGIQSAAAQKELYDSWKKCLGDAHGRCEALGGLLRKSGRDLTKTDDAVEQDMDALAKRYTDTEAVGGNIMQSDAGNHSEFFDADSLSLRNQAAVIAGHYERVALE